MAGELGLIYPTDADNVNVAQLNANFQAVEAGILDDRAVMDAAGLDDITASGKSVITAATVAAIRTLLEVEALDLQILGGKNGAAPADAKIIIQVGRVASTDVAGGIASIVFHSPFPTSCAALIPVTTSGSVFSNPRIYNDSLTKTGCQLQWNGTVGGIITVSYIAIGW